MVFLYFYNDLVESSDSFQFFTDVAPSVGFGGFTIMNGLQMSGQLKISPSNPNPLPSMSFTLLSLLARYGAADRQGSKLWCFATTLQQFKLVSRQGCFILT